MPYDYYWHTLNYLTTFSPNRRPPCKTPNTEKGAVGKREGWWYDDGALNTHVFAGPAWSGCPPFLEGLENL